MLHNYDNEVRGSGPMVSKPAFLSASECNNNGIKILRHTYICLQWAVGIRSDSSGLVRLTKSKLTSA